MWMYGFYGGRPVKGNKAFSAMILFYLGFFLVIYLYVALSR